MTRLAFVAPLALLAALAAGCSSPSKTQPAAGIKPVAQPYLAGTGVVQSVKPAPAPLAVPAPASVGGQPVSASGGQSGMQRLSIRMDNGRMIFVDTSSSEFQPGTRVQLTESNEIRRL